MKDGGDGPTVAVYLVMQQTMKEVGLLLADIAAKIYFIGVIISAIILYGRVLWSCFQGGGLLGIFACTLFSPITLFLSFHQAIFWPYFFYQLLSP